MNDSTYFSTDLHAVTAVVNIAFDVVAIFTYVQGCLMRGPYRVDGDVPQSFQDEYTKLFKVALATSIAIFSAGCLMRGILALKYTWRDSHWTDAVATALRSSLHLELPYQAYRGRRPELSPNNGLVRILKSVELCTEMPQTCLAVTVFVLHVCIKAVYDVDNPEGLTSTKDLDLVLILTAVFGVVTSSIAAAEMLVDKPWSLWCDRNFHEHRQHGKIRYAFIRWMATAASLTSHVVLCVILAPQLQEYVFVVLTAWFIICTVLYYVFCGRLYRSVKCGYLSVLMNLPFDQDAGDEVVEQRRAASYFLASLLALIYYAGAMAISVLQARSCWFTTYRCMGIDFGHDVNCKLIAEPDYYNVLRNLTDTCIKVGDQKGDRDTPMEPRIGWVSVGLVGLDAFLYVSMCVLSRMGKA